MLAETRTTGTHAFVADRIGAALRRGKGYGRSFEEFIHDCHPTLKWGRLQRELAGIVDQIVFGEIQYAMINLPTRLGKSLFVTILMSAYNARVHPWEWTAIGACTDRLALKFSAASRDFYERAGGKTLASSRAKSEWQTGMGGGVWAVGTGATAVGSGAELLILDDPIRNAKEASSHIAQENLRDWWDSVWFMRRNSERARVVVISNRWPYGDLTAYLWKKEQGANPLRWHHVSFDGLHEKKPYDTPSTCTLHPDWREEGESLDPERFSVEEFQLRIDSGGPWAEAIVQQRPRDEAMGRRVASQFTKEKNCRPLEWLRTPEGKVRELVLGWDFNVDPMWITVGQHVAGTVQFLGEIVIEDTVTAEAIEIVKELYPPEKVERYVVYPDPSGGSRNTAASKEARSNHQLLEQAGFVVRTRPRAPLLENRFNSVNNACGVAGKEPYLFVDPEKCPRLVDAFLKYRYKEVDGRLIPDKGVYDHAFDAATYQVEFEYPVQIDGVWVSHN